MRFVVSLAGNRIGRNSLEDAQRQREHGGDGRTSFEARGQTDQRVGTALSSNPVGTGGSASAGDDAALSGSKSMKEDEACTLN
jgi:hypothetical protein